MCFDTAALQIKIVYMGLVIILWPFLAFYGPRKLFCHHRHKILNFETLNVVKNREKSPRLCIFTLAYRKILFSRLIIILWPFLAISCHKVAIFVTIGTKHPILKQKTMLDQILPPYVDFYSCLHEGPSGTSHQT